ncbi:hypothetical protein C8R45DRAFT_838720 [Mycena sanguinolenta]|nr:hypothetical protein C8R45DRAFT_838943 [Mycena sanguinolenta]KAJ6466907.1 hypothetical protein C8R45DRAFT_838720 [Mycena sanguinolenta]
MKEHNVLYKFSQLSRADLDAFVKQFCAEKPDSSIRYLIGFLRTKGHRIQRRRIFASVHRVDRLGRTLRRRATIPCTRYRVSRPNAVWHLDGHHKLILWGFVIHGIVDGYSRTVNDYLYPQLRSTETKSF